MKTLNNIRKQTGLTQRQLAGFIGKEHTQLHRFESGERTPPADAMQKIAILIKAAQFCEASNDPSLDDVHRNAWLAHAFDCRVQAKQTARRLRTIEEKATQCAALLQIVSALETQHLTDRQKRWTEEQRYQATCRLTTCNAAVQARLRIRIQLLEMEAELYEAACVKPA